ncbi:DoxX-like family protein [Nocardioides scoriae]|uniref:DoxX-like family protein n=1 Tax=Nocardioides scoriae TaxID=642780 RepID=A0A1H1R894_9ACTN|nr:DoxX family protein [Nocardioides scoriae]SDS31109.1 DoxX-like family protein [Nocardioides scoriae]
MRVVVWVVSALLAVAFLAVGLGKLVSSGADLEAAASGIPVVLFRIAGVAEVLGAVGLVLPAATRVRPWLTPLAAVCLTATMACAVVANLVVGGGATAVLPLVLGLLSAFVAWARRGPCAVAPRAATGPDVIGGVASSPRS